MAPGSGKAAARPATRLRASIAILSVAAALALPPHPAASEPAYPNHPVRIIVPYGPGGVGDTTIRVVADKLSQKLGQQFIVENRPGAGGIVAAKAAAGSPSDG